MSVLRVFVHLFSCCIERSFGLAHDSSNEHDEADFYKLPRGHAGIQLDCVIGEANETAYLSICTIRVPSALRIDGKMREPGPPNRLTIVQGVDTCL
jgi:hypothetical protein